VNAGRWHAASRRWRRSIKWRLVTLFLLLALATTAVFLFGMQRILQGGWQSYARPLVADYVDRLAAEIGSPPDAQRAAAIEERLPISVQIEGPLVQYDSKPERRRSWRGARNDHGFGEGFSLTRTTADGHRISFDLASPEQTQGPRTLGWFTLAALLALTALAYRQVRKLLRPLEEIGAGVEAYGRGDFSQPIAVRRSDELGALAARINAMAQGLEGMLDAKRALLLAISHELRSPLTRARVNAELVEEGEARDALLRDLGEMRDLITDLLESERLAGGHAALQAEPLELTPWLHALVQEQFADSGVTLAIDPAVGTLRADPMRLRLLLRNLIDNALRHSTQAPRPPEVFATLQGQNHIALGVRDFGSGVSAEELAHLAEPFYRADSARLRTTGGVGLGLFLCRLVALAHGGVLEFERAEPGLRVAAVLPR
jgi:signal transduction histidine kinase